MSWTLGALPVLLLLMGFPIFIVLLTAATVTLVLYMSVPMVALQQTMFASVNAYALLALPLFIFAGEIMDRGSIADRLVNLVRASIGRVPGKIPLTAVGAGGGFWRDQRGGCGVGGHRRQGHAPFLEKRRL